MEQALRTPQTCSYWMIRSQNPDENCNCNALQDPTLREGCNNFKSLNWNNVGVDYEVVSCPTELQQHPPCWKENGGTWPSSPPAKCASGYAEFTSAKNLNGESTPVSQPEISTQDAVLM